MGVLGLAVGLLGSSGPSEYQVKAAFLFNFAKFVDWPGESFAAEREFAICVAGDGDVSQELEAVVKGRDVDGKPVVVRSLSDPSAGDGCQILFAIDDEAAIETRSLTASGMLTVGQSKGFARHGGMINFVLVGKKVRFEVNKRSAETAGLSISSHLLKLAHDVYE
jgi:hypothetical protein